jgi:hypothetical protein
MATTIGRTAGQQTALNQLTLRQRCIRQQRLLAPVFAQILNQLPDLVGPTVSQARDLCKDLLNACRNCALLPEFLESENTDWNEIYRRVAQWENTQISSIRTPVESVYRVAINMTTAMLYLSWDHEKAGMTAAKKAMEEWHVLLVEHMDYTVEKDGNTVVHGDPLGR